MAELKRALGFWTIMALSFGSIMGTGLFFGTSVASSISGNSSIISWIILSVVAIYFSTYFAELVAIFPKAGGVYEYSKHAYNRFFSFLMGWIAWLVGNLTTAILVVAAIDYLIPDPSLVLLKIGVSIGLILVLNLIAFFGIEASAFMLVFFAAVSISVLLSIIIPGYFAIDRSNYVPFYAAGISGVFVTIFFIAESFFGWESTTYLAEETQNPEKIIPLSLILGTIIVAILGIAITTVSLGVVPWKVLAGTGAPLTIVSQRLMGSFGQSLVNIGIFVALIGAAAGGIVSMPRLILALARDKLFIAQFADVHERFKTPHKAIVFQTIVSLIIFGMAFGRYTSLLSLLVPLGLIMYFFVVLTVPILRWKEPNLKRTYKVPFVTVGSILLIIFIFGLILAWVFPFLPSFGTVNSEAIAILKLGFSFLLVGVPIYLMLEVYYNPDTIVAINDFFAYLTLLTERFVLPKSIRKEILALLGNVNGKKVLEFGCSVGTLTLPLAEAVNPSGRVYATDLSEKDLMITKKRVTKQGHQHVFVIHDKHQVNRVHPSIPHVDAVVSIGMMGYMQDVQKVLREMRELLPYGGKIVFVDYADFFKIIPNVKWLSNDKVIEKTFRDAGFSVNVTRKKGLLWNYVFVHGIKFHENIPYI